MNLENFIELSAEFIVKETSKFNSSAMEDLRGMAPETTPSNVEVRLGTSYMMVGEISYKDFLKGAIYSYLKFNNVDFEAPESREIYENYIADGSLDWSKDLNSAAGTSMPSQDYVWVSFLPDDFESQLASGLSHFLAQRGVNSVNPDILSRFVLDFSGRGKVSGESRVDYLATLNHEVTHLMIKRDTAIGGLYHNHEVDDTDLMDEVNSILGNSSKVSKSEQAKRVGSNEYISALDEMFAFFIGNNMKSEVSMSRPSKFSGYDNPEAISWGYNLLVEKFGNDISIDELRKLELKIFEEIAQRGQVTKGSDYRNPLVYLMKYLLPQKDKDLLEDLRTLCEGDLATAFSDLRQAVEDGEAMEKDRGNKGVYSEFKDLEEKVDWDNPREIEDEVLNNVFKEGIGNYSLKETHEKIWGLARKELEKIDNIIEVLKDLENDIDVDQADRELISASKEMLKVENELKAVLKKAS